MSDQPEINALNQDQPKNQQINAENQPILKSNLVEDELAECLKVDSDCESDVSTLSEKKHVPKTLKTRKAIIRKIQETATHLGNEVESKENVFIECEKTALITC